MCSGPTGDPTATIRSVLLTAGADPPMPHGSFRLSEGETEALNRVKPTQGLLPDELDSEAAHI